MANWENLNNVPLQERKWDGTVYSSPKSFMSEDLIWSTHPKNNKIFAVWLNQDGILKIPDGSKLLTVYRTDSLFVETSVGITDFTEKSGYINLTNPSGIGKGYIFSLK